MNYIRGAVNAISAPYQYYKDLPPINPSTLTGAIDVIVIQRPTDSGDTELVCSPFHVRFGKWQVLRPGEKKVNVSVNGHPIPFNMKIGEAGEAFFVFETDDDVPEDLITSPLLQPTRPDEAGPKDEDVPVDRFGAKEDPDGQQTLGTDEDGAIHMRNEEELRKEDPETENQEPEFLDLDARPSSAQADEDASKNANITPKQTFTRPSFTQMHSNILVDKPSQALPSPPPTPTHRPSTYTPEMVAQDLRVDEALKSAKDSLHVPEVEYHHDIAIDVEGYHSHNRERSDRTVMPSRNDTFPSGRNSRSRTPSPVQGLDLSHSQYQPAEELSESGISTHAFPSFRATSEPPPDFGGHAHRIMTSSQDQSSSSSSSKLATLSPVQEYSWEWGAFPQPSPMKASFGKGGRIEGSLGRSWGSGKRKGKGKGKASMDLSSLTTIEFDEENREAEHEHGRSRSVPPELEGSPTRDRRGRELYEDHEGYNESEDIDADGAGEVDAGGEDREVDPLGFGKGGTLSTSKADSSRFILQIEGKKVAFELSVVSNVDRSVKVDGAASESEDAGDHNEPRGRKNRHGGLGGTKVFDGRDEVEAARIFSQGKIDFQEFLDDEDLVHDPGLVIRWADEQYITRSDGSPLMHALVLWREAVLRRRANGVFRPTSPLSEEEPDSARTSSTPPPADEEEDRYHHRSKSEPPEKPPGKPTSSSWVQWWSRSGRKNARTKSEVEKEDTAPSQTHTNKSERPSLRGTASAPLGNGSSSTLPDSSAMDQKSISREIPPAESAPAYPSTPVQGPIKDLPPTTPVTKGPAATRKFAKTLRLTSEQLKALNLKPGPNTITFSLSTSGVIACTARIFVWDSTDLVMISDIDGTITKSDGLGHVFAMIGRDWTHLGVAKLYTDITRNGYKIMYLTSRAIGQADATRDYLKGIKQNDYQLPDGPVIMSPDRLMASLHREVIMRKPEVFKMACLRDIQRLFGEASRNPFYAGFGNRITDALSYRSVNVPSARIFTIDSTGEVKMELLELAGYKSSYIHMTDLVDQMFPPIHRKWTPEFTDFNYWKTPVQDFPLPDFSPPSPALSARSDTSQGTLARIRNFSLVGSRQGTMRMVSPPADGSKSEHRNSHLRQISSFEKLSNTLGFAQTSSMTNGDRRSASPDSSVYDSDDEDEEEVDADGKRRKRERRRSITSMPGTLDERHFGMDDDDDDDDDEPHYGSGGEEEEDMEEEDAGDETFDEDILAAGEMKNVPFL